MMKKNWWSRLVAVSAYGSSKSRFQRRRASQMRCADEQLEIRTLLSSQYATSELTGLPGLSDDDDADENELADEPVDVTGTFLTSQSRADSKPMFFNDIRQGQLDTCVFTSTLAAVALTDFNLADAISVQSQTPEGITYNVRLWAKNTQNQFTLHDQVVHFDFKLTEQDPAPGDSQEYWPAIFQRAYLDLASSLERNYKIPAFALESLMGAAATGRVMQNSLAFAKQIQTDLLAGRATITATINASSRYIGGAYGLVHNHAYTIMGIEVPTSNSLNDVYVTVRNPWRSDTGGGFFDADQDGKLSGTEYRNYLYGIDGTNDGLIRLPWSVFAANFNSTYMSSRTGASINTPLPVYSFTKPSPPAVTIYEGQRLRVDVPTTHSSGMEVYYVMNSSSGDVHFQDGIFEWEPKAASAGRHAVSIRAFINPFITTDIAFIVTVLPSGPTIGSVTASPTTIKNDGSDLLTLTPNDIQSPFTAAEAVEFWLDQDGNNEFNSSVDRWLGVSDGVWQGYVGGLVVGSQTFFARAYWQSFGDTHYGAARATTVNVEAAAFVEQVAIPRGGQQGLTSSQENNFAIHTLQDASGQYRVLSRWEYSVSVPGISGATYYNEYRVRLLGKNGTLLQTTAVAEKDAVSPDLFVSADGTFAVVWEFYGQNQPGTKKLQWYNADGSPQGAAKVIAGSVQAINAHLQIAGDSAGNLLVVYNVGGYFEEDIWALSVARDGTVTRAPWQVNTNTVGPQKNPTVALNDNGVGVIAWSDFGDASVGQPVQTVARQVWNYGRQNGDEFIVSAYARMDRFLGSDVNLAGEFAIAFYVDETSIFVQKFSAAGVPIGEAFRANSFMGSHCQDPSISLNDAGWMVVAWDNWRQDGTANNGVGVYSQLFDPSGNRYGAEFAVPVEREYEQVLAGVVLDNTGQLHFTWTNGGYLNPLHDTVETRLFDVKLPPVIVPNQSFDVAENLPAGTVVGTVAAADPNPDSVFSFEMVGSSGFSIDPLTGVIRTTGPLDFETFSTFALYVRVTSNDGFAVSAVTVEVLDRIDGTNGVDVLELRFASNNVTVARSTDSGPLISLGTFPLTSPLELQLLQSTDTVRILGTSGNDSFRLSGAGMFVNNTRLLIGGPAALQFAGQAGNDTYQFGTDTLLSPVQIVESESGVDTIDFSPTLAMDVRLDLSSVTTQTVNANLSLRLNSGTLIENARGGSRNDVLTGNTAANILSGNAGGDTLNGGRGNDSLTGGLGNDTYMFAAAASTEADTLTEGANGGTDTISFASLSVPVTFSLATGSVQPVHSNRTIKLNSTIQFENVAGGTVDDTLTGNTVVNILNGNAGGDTLAGAGGNDTLIGGTGNDSYVFTAATSAEADSLTEGVNGGVDTICFATLTVPVTFSLITGSVQSAHTNRTIQLNSRVQFENLTGGASNDVLTGNTVANTLNGNAGNDTLNAGAGSDAFLGGLGNDVYIFGLATSAEADTATEGVNGGTDTLSFAAITTNVTFSLATGAVQPVHANRTLRLNSTIQFENAAGGSGNDTLTGNTVSNVLIGNVGNDRLTGGGGRDILIGGLGLDTLIGGDDEDILIAGRTTSDALFSNLNTLQLAWLSGSSYATRITNLRAGVGSPVVSLKAKVNVLNDAGEDDSLTGGSGTDWYFRAADDVIADLMAGETLAVL